MSRQQRATRRASPYTATLPDQEAAQTAAQNAARAAAGGDPGIWSPHVDRPRGAILRASDAAARAKWPLVAGALFLALLIAAPMLAVELALVALPVAAVAGAALLTRRWLRAGA